VFEVPSLPHLIMVLVIFALLFGAKRVPEIAGSLGKGIKEFKQNIRDDAPETMDLSRNDHSSELRRTVDYRRDDAVRQEPRRLID
jgi:sec-independent protein translocase protein TatA